MNINVELKNNCYFVTFICKSYENMKTFIIIATREFLFNFCYKLLRKKIRGIK